MMTKDEIIELLQGIKIENVGGDELSANLEYLYHDAWVDIKESLPRVMVGIGRGYKCRIKHEPKYEPYTHDDAELFLGKMFRFKTNKKLYLVVDT